MQDKISRTIPISGEDVSNHLKFAERDIFRLETLDSYLVDWDNVMYPQYLSGLPLPQEIDPRWEEWFSSVRDTADQGKSLTRIHLIPEILTSYLRYEIEWGYKLFNEPSGEKVFLAMRNSFLRPEMTQDFNLIDEKTLIYIKYNSNNSWTGFEIEQNPQIIASAVSFKDELLANAIPLVEFLKKMRQAPLILENE